ncbi:hypothetical protein [Pseudomonas sp. RIT357]|uniref:hypothetical protein n=1 Tax=Pseudomonas sp. RIT357 TaxID=1470593 RepID=UPI00044B16E3|nr:hypothetical protein [Pseudomonas sp. RIT357]EZP65827.1 hypothetical protein BW43_02975 [Pseudomonas sp. RIT357]
MDDKQDTSAESTEKPKARMPDQFSIQSRGFTDVETATRLGKIVGEVIRAIAHKFDLRGLDGITLAVDYNQALLDLDRGYETNYKLKPTNSHVIGVAMTPSVLRDGSLKSHIVLNAAHIAPLLDPDDAEGRDHAIHVLAHECGHVQVTNAFDQCFPNVLLRPSYGSIQEQIQWQVILAVWDEFAVTSISAGIGESQTESYENTFINDLAQADDRSNRLLLNYQEHGSVDRILGEIYGCYGDLLKFAAYHLGNLDGLGVRWQDSQKTASILKDHWFLPYFERLNDACIEIAKSYGQWENKDSFTLIADIVDELVERAGLLIEPMDDGRLWVNIPYTPETDPLLCK